MRDSIDDVLEDRLRGVLPPVAFVSDQAAYLTEPRGRFSGRGLVVKPGSTEEVSRVMAVCHELRVPVVPYAGGTGLVGGQLKGDGPAPLVLSVERMSALRRFDPVEGLMTVEAGMILAHVQAAAEEAGMIFPLWMASEGSARVGGLLATNAGGINVLRYGSARAQCLGLEVVLPDGRVWNGLSRLFKNNMGYDLRDLFIGSEGTLGLITAASLRMQPRPACSGTACMAVSSPEAALDLLALVRDHVGDDVSAFELIGRMGLEFLSAVGPEVRMPFPQAPEWMVLMELGLPSGHNTDQTFEAIFSAATDRGLVSQGTVAQSFQQTEDLWAMREAIPEANRRIGSISSHDISVPLGSIPEFIDRAGPLLARIGTFRINCFGHLGDGNLHYNVFPPLGRQRGDFVDLRDEIKRTVHDLVHELGGSVSAEHGVGRLKVGDLETYGDPVGLALMRQIKAAFDPHGIMNPGAVLRA